MLDIAAVELEGVLDVLGLKEMFRLAPIALLSHHVLDIISKRPSQGPDKWRTHNEAP
jgi:hypothetical protein